MAAPVLHDSYCQIAAKSALRKASFSALFIVLIGKKMSLSLSDRNLANILTKPVINKEDTKTVSTSDLDGNHRDPLLISKQEPWYIEDATIKDGRID